MLSGLTGQAPLPELAEPTRFVPVSADCDEPLVTVEHNRVFDLSCYERAGWPHTRPHLQLREGAAQRLYRVADRMPEPFGIAVFDAWRALELQQAIYEAAYADPHLPAGFVSHPNPDPANPPPHLTGGTVDLTLAWDGQALALGTSFDDFHEGAHAASLESDPGPERELRRFLYWHMHAAGFVVLAQEWWHFEYGTQRWAAITGNEPIYAAAS